MLMPESAATPLDRLGRYLTDCALADDHDGEVRFCPNHPVTNADLWTLYCARRATSDAG